MIFFFEILQHWVVSFGKIKFKLKINVIWAIQRVQYGLIRMFLQPHLSKQVTGDRELEFASILQNHCAEQVHVTRLDRLEFTQVTPILGWQTITVVAEPSYPDFIVHDGTTMCFLTFTQGSHQPLAQAQTKILRMYQRRLVALNLSSLG